MASRRLDLVARVLVDPGDVVIAEAPTYPGAVPVFSAYEAEVIQIEMDGEGMRVDLLEETLERLAREGRRPKFIYTVPTFHNPAGVTMSLPRRKRLVELADKHEVLVLEDNPYGLLRYEGAPLPTLRELDGGVYVMYLGTFSKILSPGIRLGWIVAPPPVLEKINLGKQAADLCSSTLSQMVVQAYFEQVRWRDYVESLTETYRARRDTMFDALGETLPPQAEWTRPQGGLFIWVTLPDFIDTTDLLARALRENVAFVPGAAAYVDGAVPARCGSTSPPRAVTTSARASAGSAPSSPSRWPSTGRSPARSTAVPRPSQPPAAPRSRGRACRAAAVPPLR